MDANFLSPLLRPTRISKMDRALELERFGFAHGILRRNGNMQCDCRLKGSQILVDTQIL